MKTGCSLFAAVVSILLAAGIRDASAGEIQISPDAVTEFAVKRRETITAIHAVLEENKTKCSTFRDSAGLWKTEEGKVTVRQVEAAIVLAGCIRGSELAEDLVHFVEFASPEHVSDSSRIQAATEVFPAVKSLIAIGQPSVDAITKKVFKGELSETAVRNYASVLAEVSCPHCLRYRFKRLGPSTKEAQIERLLSKVERLSAVKSE